MPGTCHRFFCLTDTSAKKLAGFLVYSVENKVALIKDLFLQDMDTHLDPLFLYFFREMRKEKNVNSIQICYIGNQNMIQRLKKLLFIKRAADRQCMVYTRKDMTEELKQKIFLLDNWFLFEGDMDI